MQFDPYMAFDCIEKNSGTGPKTSNIHKQPWDRASYTVKPYVIATMAIETRELGPEVE